MPLQAMFMKGLHRAACEGAARLVEKKAAKQGIRFSPADLASLASHFEDPAHELKLNPTVDDAKGHVTLDVSDIDVGALGERVMATIPELLKSEPGIIAARMLPTLKRNWAAQARWQARTQASFEKRLARRWRAPFKLLGMCVTIATEFGSNMNTYGREPDALNAQPHKTDVLTRLHARACQVANEIRTLLASGFADGAMARWRTLHEIAVIAMFIAERDEGIAERYALHGAVESRKAARQHREFAQRLDEPPLTDEEMAALEQHVATLIERFKGAFATDYGWAADALANPKPTFADIERAAKVDHWRPYYRLASHNVHANPKGIFFKLGLVEETGLLLAGASNYGLADPGQNTALSLLHVTVALNQLRPTLDGMVVVKILQELCDEVAEAFVRVQRQIKAADRSLKKRVAGMAAKAGKLER
jgi:hypothetical protein